MIFHLLGTSPWILKSRVWTFLIFIIFFIMLFLDSPFLYSSSSSCLCNSHTCTASRRTLSVLACRAVREIHPMVPAAVYMPVCLANGNSLPVMPFQGYLVTHPPPPSLPLGPPGTTYNVVGTGFLHPIIEALGSSICWESCQLHELSCWLLNSG